MAPPPPPSPTVQVRRTSWVRRLWSFIVFLLVVGAWGAAGYIYLELRHEKAARDELARAVADFEPRFERFKAAVRDVDRHLSATVFQEVDLAAAGWQPIAGGFYVIDLAAAASASPPGLKVSGKIINPTSVTHEAARLSARVGEHRATFALAHVPPAVAQSFEITIPDAPATAKRAYFALDSSTISFSSSTTRKRTAVEPMDTDKALR